MQGSQSPFCSRPPLCHRREQTLLMIAPNNTEQRAGMRLRGLLVEETAVAAMKARAHDYLMKDNMARLVPAVERELREAETRRGRRISEQKLKMEHTFRKTIENSIPSGIAVMDLSKVQTYVN